MLGAIAWDTIATTHSDLRANTDLNHKLDQVWTGLGGCAANICYTLRLLGHSPSCIAPLGELAEIAPEFGVNDAPGVHHGMLKMPGPMSRAFIITDPNGTQRTYFAPGVEPSTESWRTHIERLPRPDWVVQAPLVPELMLEGLAWARSHNAITLWCPGQYAALLDAQAIEQGLAHTHILVVNQGERALLEPWLANQEGLWQITTDGASPVQIQRGSQSASVVVPAVHPVDPTGCGDALLAGLTGSLVNAQATPAAMSYEIIKQATLHGVAAASACLTKIGCQNHQLNLSDLF